MVAHTHQNFDMIRHPQVDARAESHESDPFTSCNDVTLLFPRDDATGYPPGNLLEYDLAVDYSGKYILLIVERRALGPSGHEFAWLVFETGDRS